MTLRGRKRVQKQRDAQLVEKFRTGHIQLTARRVTKKERQEVEVIVSPESETIEFDIAFDLQVLASVEQRPRGSRQTDAANVEVRKPGTTLIEDMIDPWEQTLSCFRLLFSNKPVKRFKWHSIGFQQHEALNFRVH
jgi:hypothetical protein